ncbi:GDSL-type esterase/lipase family protein [Sphingomonas sp. HITSZ_GF]|uniref:GDSL-type esterase/lipase family protein n=1 Tax=Sphingomonas sp. HITSZ_GF TaxID=3037247 RepID=UPI00240D28EC|nr:GDSL-type esterase/lipase family protein [Sphingomonas sp. HITSZ_GF]MDG2536017.1 GDSL-type esterase/lipase family protein [Sphingomonas sp. HITSZ_GF]
MPFVRRGFLTGTLLLPFAARAQESWEEQHQRQLKEDWPWLGRYAEDNRKLIAARRKVDIVFMGDSITEGWQSKRPGFFTPGRVCRGISGQTTPQMVLRMMADVIALKPRLVHIMAGTNDIAGNTGKITVAQSCDNLRMMAELARANGIRVLLASVPPADNFPWRPGLETVKPIRAINVWLAGYARRTGATWIDYTPVLADAKGAMKPGLAYDGVHPTETGYAAMEKKLLPILRVHKA